MNKLAQEIHQNAINKGFWDKPLETGTLLMLVTSELGEALEADRNNDYADKKQIEAYKKCEEKSQMFEQVLKDTFEDEIADSIIRLLDLAAVKNIDIDFHIREKMRYNKTRKKLHGKKY